MDYDAYNRIRKPVARKTIILNGGIKRIKDRIRDEIEKGIEEWEESNDDEGNNLIQGNYA